MSGKLRGEWFWTDRWATSSARSLPIEPRGLYREMLTVAWANGARLPNDHEAIRRLTACSESEWSRCWPLIEHYWRVDGDALVNDTQQGVYADSAALATMYRERASVASNARWHKNNGKEHGDEPPREKLPKSSRGSKRCPADFVLTPERRQFAIEDGMPDAQIEREFEKFRDHTFATAKTDWDATWRNWVRTCTQRQNTPPPRFNSPAAQPSRPQPDPYKRPDTPEEREWRKNYLARLGANVKDVP